MHISGNDVNIYLSIYLSIYLYIYIYGFFPHNSGYTVYSILMSLLFSCSAQLCLTLCDSIDWSMPGYSVLHHLREFAQTHVHWVGDAIHPSHLLSPCSPPAFSLSQYQDLFQWFSSSQQVAKVLELRLQHQSFQWISTVDVL